MQKTEMTMFQPKNDIDKSNQSAFLRWILLETQVTSGKPFSVHFKSQQHVAGNGDMLLDIRQSGQLHITQTGSYHDQTLDPIYFSNNKSCIETFVTYMLRTHKCWLYILPHGLEITKEKLMDTQYIRSLSDTLLGDNNSVDITNAIQEKHTIVLRHPDYSQFFVWKLQYDVELAGYTIDSKFSASTQDLSMILNYTRVNTLLIRD